MSTVEHQGALSLNEHWAHRRKLAVLCRIADLLGYIGAFGHISIRVPGTDIVLITPGAGAEKSTVRADQIFGYGLDGALLHHPGGDLMISEPLEHDIHTRIHRDRPEIMCVAHLHAPNSTLLGIADAPIVPVINQAFYLAGQITTWDDPALVVSDSQAAELSQRLGDGIACQMRGHGSVVVGETPEVGLLNCYNVEENARYQIAAAALGGAVPFSAEVMDRNARQRAGINSVADILWTYFERRVGMTGVPL